MKQKTASNRFTRIFILSHVTWTHYQTFFWKMYSVCCDIKTSFLRSSFDFQTFNMRHYQLYLELEVCTHTWVPQDLIWPELIFLLRILLNKYDYFVRLNTSRRGFGTSATNNLFIQILEQVLSPITCVIHEFSLHNNIFNLNKIELNI
jgi:hypothetical protein